ncbi:hypothetical protein CEE44_00755 [Candidatus Woesearchaeota archaeon B3_Woes]|nr:MAG: hypothetical protein CEE44_00755 [Candidatus Woesearchaeota archaeon B3_Woes]
MTGLTLEELRQNTDDWVREMNSKVEQLTNVPDTVVENTGNIQHNYELVTDLRSEIEDLKQEIKLLKLMHLVALKEKKLKH